MIYTTLAIKIQQSKLAPTQRVVRFNAFRIILADAEFDWGFKPSSRLVAHRAPALREGWLMPRNPDSTDNRRQRFIKCHVKYWGMPSGRKQSRIPPDFSAEGGSSRVIKLEKIVMSQELKRKGLSISVIALRTGLDQSRPRHRRRCGACAP